MTLLSFEQVAALHGSIRYPRVGGLLLMQMHTRLWASSSSVDVASSKVQRYDHCNAPCQILARSTLGFQLCADLPVEAVVLDLMATSATVCNKICCYSPVNNDLFLFRPLWLQGSFGLPRSVSSSSSFSSHTRSSLASMPAHTRSSLACIPAHTRSSLGIHLSTLPEAVSQTLFTSVRYMCESKALALLTYDVLSIERYCCKRVWMGSQASYNVRHPGISSTLANHDDGG